MSFAFSVLPSATRIAARSAGAARTLAAPAAAGTSLRALSTFSTARSTLSRTAASPRASTPTTPSRRPRHQQQARARALSTDTRTKLESLVSSAPLVLFMKGTPEMPMCGFSRAVVQILDVQGVNLRAVRAVNVLEDEEVRQGVKEFSDWPTIPQVYVQGEFVGGCDILMNMHKSGELEDLLLKHNLVAPSADDAGKS